MRWFVITLLTLTLMMPIAAQGQGTSGTLYLVETEPAPGVVSPLSARTAAEWRLVELIYAPLCLADSYGVHVNALAEKVQITNAGKQLTVSIRDDARWSMGRDVTAGDVVYTYRLAMAGKWNQAYKDRLRLLKHVRPANDGLSVVFELKAAAKNPKTILTVPLVPNRLHGPANAPDRLRPTPLAAVGAGPFTFAKQTDPTRLVANRNAAEQPRIAEIRIIRAGTPASALDLVRLLGNAVTFVTDPIDATILNREFGDRAFKQSQQHMTFIAFDPKSSLLAEPAIRLAVAHSLNRNDLFGPGGKSRATHSPVAPGSPLVKGKMTVPSFDLNAARQVLTGAGWQLDEKQVYFVRKSKHVVDIAGDDPSTKRMETLTLTMLIDGDSAKTLRRAAAIQYRLLQAGIQLIVNARPRYVFLSQIRSRRYPMALVTMAVPLKNHLRPLFHSKGGRRVTVYSNKKLDQHLDAGKFTEAIHILVKKAPLFFLGLERGMGAAGQSVQVSGVTGPGGLQNAARWQIQ